MFDKETKAQERGQVGIGTLIVFIALVLVAAIAAGVLINTAGFLQSQAEATGEESTNQVSSGVNVVSASGTDTTADSTTNIDTATLTVSKQAGSKPIDLTSIEVQVVGPSGTALIEIAPNNLANVVGDDKNILEEQSDRVEIELDLATNGAGELTSGDSADLTITTADGAQTFKTLQASNPVEDPEDF